MQGLYTTEGRITGFQMTYGTPKGWGAVKLQEQVFVPARKGLSVEYSSNEVRAIGVVQITIQRDPDTQRITRLFEMDLDRVEPL